MKTYGKIFLMVILVGMFFLIGCAGRQSSSLDTSKDGIVVHKNTNLSLLMYSPGPVELARAEQISANAKLTKKLADQIKTSDVAGAQAGQIIGVLINDDPFETAYVSHPDLSQKIEVSPNSFAFISVNNIPNELTVYKENGHYQSFSVTPKTKTYNGVPCKFGLRIKNL